MSGIRTRTRARARMRTRTLRMRQLFSFICGCAIRVNLKPKHTCCTVVRISEMLNTIKTMYFYNMSECNLICLKISTNDTTETLHTCFFLNYIYRHAIITCENAIYVSCLNLFIWTCRRSIRNKYLSYVRISVI